MPSQTDQGADRSSPGGTATVVADGDGRTVALQNAIQAAEHERARWARELHDQTLQALAALRVSLSSARRRNSSEELERAVAGAVVQIGGEIEKLRSLIAELRPAALDEIGLAAALRAMAERSAMNGGLSLEMRVNLNRPGRVGSPALETTIYRLVQEAVANVVKHAQASTLTIEAEEREGRLAVLVRDNGLGFEPAIQPEGLGIAGMRERVGLAGGRFEVTSAPGEGTSVSASMPLQEAGTVTALPARRFAAGE